MAYDVEKEKRIEVFQDTLKTIEKSEILKNSVKNSINNTKLYKEGFVVEPQQDHCDCTILVKNIRSFAALDLFSSEIENPCVLNFASATNPGGGVERGSNAQEECLCRCSTLFNVISNKKFFQDYYGYHRSRRIKDKYDTIYTDRAMFSPNIVVFKEDIKTPRLMEEKKWKTCSVITCAAPNLRERKITDKELLEIMKSRIRAILSIAIENKVDGIVLGAFGCGAFKCSPNVVARAFREVLINEKYAHYFKEIVFAVLGVPNKDMENFEVFQRVFR